MTARWGRTASDRYDLIVLGGGVVGTMTALFARKRHPGWRVLVIDRSLIGSGASMYSAYMDFPYGPSAIKRAMAERSALLWGRLRAELTLPIRDLDLFGICSPDRLEAVSQGLVGAPRGEPWTARTRGLLAHALPGFVAPPASVVLPGLPAARCTDRNLPETIAAALIKDERAAYLEGVEVTDIAPGGAGLELRIHDHDRRFETPRVAICLGPWLPGALPGLARVTAPVRVKKVVSLHVPIAPPDDAPLIYLFDDEAFLLPQPDKRRWLFSFRSDAWDVEPDAARLQISPADWDRATALLGRYLPAAAELELGGRVFCDAYTATGEPYIAPIAELPGCVIAGAGSGSGFRLAPAIAERAVDLLSDPSGLPVLQGTP